MKIMFMGSRVKKSESEAEIFFQADQPNPTKLPALWIQKGVGENSNGITINLIKTKEKNGT